MVFKPGQAPGPGRPTGLRNKINAMSLNDLLEEWKIGGRDAMKTMRIEDPTRFVLAVLALQPKEIAMEIDRPLKELTADILDKLIEQYERGEPIDVTPQEAIKLIPVKKDGK
jgi:hypothetical protein